MSFLRIGAAVAQAKFHLWGLLDKLFDAAILLDQVDGLVFRHREIGVHLMVVGHRHQRLTDIAAHKGTHMVGDHRSRTTHRALHHRITEVIAGVQLLSLGLCQCGLRLVQGVLHGPHGVVAHHLFVFQRLTALIFHLCRLQLGLGSRHTGLSHLQSSLIRHLVDDEQGLSLGHHLPLVDANTGDIA